MPTQLTRHYNATCLPRRKLGPSLIAGHTVEPAQPVPTITPASIEAKHIVTGCQSPSTEGKAYRHRLPNDRTSRKNVSLSVVNRAQVKRYFENIGVVVP